MYAFILSMWVAKKIIEGKVRSYSPKFISPEEADLVLATPQL
ncbi:hypothetical protein Back11_12170 [Paenibacillus baekrokdamisoli]|uniref:Uncharacterized protein n=1 Tax=Paenibacillus baekrokdamisoli TaxID=1712516 RepID=A0A3G9INQ9_9BACL|nr:hypothetical protein [Paenibacillus baekrokdamisoli]MBB3070522.1 hypothetical protein [Paenibacillus baekrokdamisoli]BBH19872.1 hypothetical protein Back11_12170 [Paenibacillus baekrokdamisoli]